MLFKHEYLSTQLLKLLESTPYTERTAAERAAAERMERTAAERAAAEREAAVYREAVRSPASTWRSIC